MTITDFQELDYLGRMQATNTAVCISGRDEGEFIVLLYQLNGFYIEVYYHRRLRFIHQLHAFDDMDLLEPYLEKMQVSFTY